MKYCVHTSVSLTFWSGRPERKTVVFLSCETGKLWHCHFQWLLTYVNTNSREHGHYYSKWPVDSSATSLGLLRVPASQFEKCCSIPQTQNRLTKWICTTSVQRSSMTPQSNDPISLYSSTPQFLQSSQVSLKEIKNQRHITKCKLSRCTSTLRAQSTDNQKAPPLLHFLAYSMWCICLVPH